MTGTVATLSDAFADVGSQMVDGMGGVALGIAAIVLTLGLSWRLMRWFFEATRDN